MSGVSRAGFTIMVVASVMASLLSMLALMIASSASAIAS